MDKYNIDLDENERRIQEAKRRLEAEKKPTGSRELEILKGLYADAGKPFPNSADPGEIDHVFFMDAAKEARRLYELEMTDEDRAAEREQIRKQVQKAKEKGAGALNWAEYLKSRDLWERIQDETQKDIINRAYTQIISELELLSLNLAGIIQYYPQDEKKYRKDLKEFDRCRAVIKDAFYSLPFFIAEYSKPQYGGKCPADLYEDAEKDENGKPAESSLYSQAERAALKAYRAEFFPWKISADPVEKVNVKRAEKIIYPTDDFNYNAFGYKIPGNIIDKFELSSESKSKKAFLQYAVDFSSIADPQKRLLTHYMRRVYVAAKALWTAGNETITASQIYSVLRSGTLGRADVLKIDETMELMNNTFVNVFIDRESVKNYKTLREKLKDGESYKLSRRLIDFRRTQKFINGKLSNAAYTLLSSSGESPFATFDFAEIIEQITSFSPDVLKIPVSMTEDNLAIDDYLLKMINWHREDGQKFELIISNLYDNAGIKSKSQRSKKAETIKHILSHYKSIGFIKNYEITNKRIIITPTKIKK